MPSWPKGDRRSPCDGGFMPPRLACRGRRLRRAPVFSAIANPTVSASAQQRPANDPFAFQANELTLAGLRPGRDTILKAKKICGGPWRKSAPDDPSVLLVRGDCTAALLRLEGDKSGVIQQIVVLAGKNASEVEKRSVLPPTCADLNGAEPMSAMPIDKRNLRWITGRKISLGAITTALHAEYSDPGNKSPSTRGGQPLELWYCAFDWAGPNVTQVTEVLCTREQNGEPGRVVELTLAAPSL